MDVKACLFPLLSKLFRLQHFLLLSDLLGKQPGYFWAFAAWNFGHFCLVCVWATTEKLHQCCLPGAEVNQCHEECHQITYGRWVEGGDFLIFVLLPCVVSRLPPVTMAIGIPGKTFEKWTNTHTGNYLCPNICLSSIYVTKHFSVYYTTN